MRALLIGALAILLTSTALRAAEKVSGQVVHDETSATDRKALERFFTQRPVRAEWFAPAFLAAIPIDTIAAIADQIVAQEGAFERLEVRDGAYYAVFANAENHVLVATDGDGKFTLLRLLAPVARSASLDDALAKLGAAGGEVSYLITGGGTDVAAASADRPMAVGSSFKLVVLAALRAQIDAKTRAWSDVVPLAPGAKSLPSGTFQSWPDGTPITLATYAAQMISLSDNTAADALAQVVGRAALEALSPRNTPFLTTRELFALKTKDAALRDAYRAGDLATRRVILAKLDAQDPPDAATLDLSPAYLDVEWYLTTRELCGFMARVRDLPLMAINPGVPSPAWKRIAYKGGSDAGVLNLTSYVTAPNGKSYCVSATWNDRTRSPDEAACIAAFGAVLAQLAKR